MPLDDHITSININPLSQIQHTREVKDEHRRRKREGHASDKRRKDTLELTGDGSEERVIAELPEEPPAGNDNPPEDVKPHIDIVIH